LLLSAPSFAGPLELEGRLVQGGLLFGRTEPGARVELDGRAVRVSPDGRFVVGFNRDAGPESLLRVSFADGSEAKRQLAIASREYEIQRIDGLPQEQVTPPEAVLARIRAEQALINEVRALDRPEALFASGFVWPAQGPISGVYGSQRILNGEPRQPHYGVDIAAPEGTPVVAPADGVVALVHPDMYFTGGTVILDHGHGLTSAFLHLKEILVRQGQRLRQGEPLATIGATGRVTGAHLDWRINWFDVRVDPALLVPPMPAQEAPAGSGGG